MISVHPRIRGERTHTRNDSGSSLGSSPHTRGTHGKRLRAIVAKRFIPAYAGNARDRQARHHRRAVHPRIRGERYTLHGVTQPGTGSSPHTRGTRRSDGMQFAVGRFIPAYAGNAPMARGTSCSVTVHPRIRGERGIVSANSCRAVGSSPHTRGTQAGEAASREGGRFIPAYAGNA